MLISAMRHPATSAPSARILGSLGIACTMLLADGCAHPRAQRVDTEPRLAAGHYEFIVQHGDRRRTYLVHVPPRSATRTATRSATRPPVLLAFHGGGGTAANFESYAELDRVADREGFLVVYPNGTGPLPNSLLTWNAGDGCCGPAMNQRVDDVGFAAAVIDDLERRTPIDRHRIYATGHSNGAILAHRLAAERPDLFAAIAAVSGSLDLAHFAPPSPVPVLQIHSVDDPRALYAGGLGPPFPGTQSRVQHQPVLAGLARWAAADGCSPAPDTVEMKRGALGTRDAGMTATKLVWHPCRGGAEVVHWRLTGAGHGWPGTARPAAGERLVGPQTSIIHAADEVWAFVSRFSR
jgi:polyhydroxybutyrate depolymerase